MSVEPGQIIDGKYRVIRRIGEGGMGTVYEGENSRIGRRVAIKVLHANVAAMPEFVERFEHEARAAARIGSPFVCDVLDLGDLPGGDRYIVMEYLDGVSFEDRVGDGGKLTCAQLAPIAFELLEGLGTMHNARVIHRDLKPANVFLSRIAGGRGEVVKILDFGVAKLLPMSGEVGSMTQTGTMMGTPLYMSPEQARGAKDVDGRTDLYAASVMFYRALTGVLPYNADTLNELLFKIVLEDPKPLRDVAPEVDERFAEIVHKGLARDLKDRWESARDYQEAIAAWGRAQGRQSLAFAVTAPLDGALSTGANYSRRAPSNPGLNPGSQPGNATGNATGNGTPIAWSEDAPRSSRVPSGQATVMDALGATPSAGAPSAGVMAAAAPASATPATVKHLPLAAPAAGSAQAAAAVGSAARAGLDGNAPPATSTLASPLESSKDGSAAAEPPVANATTVPTAPIADLTRAPSASAPSKRGLVFGAAGAGAIGLVAFLAFGRGGAPAPAGLTPAAGTGESTAASSATTATEPSAATATATASPSSAANAAASTSAGAADPSASASATAPPIAGGSHGTSPRRTNDGAARPGTTTATGTTAAATATAATAATVTAAPPPASATTAKPAGSARKFRTNID